MSSTFFLKRKIVGGLSNFRLNKAKKNWYQIITCCYYFYCCYYIYYDYYYHYYCHC